MNSIKVIKIGKHVKIFRYPWRFGFGISIQKFYGEWNSLYIDLGLLTISIEF